MRTLQPDLGIVQCVKLETKNVFLVNVLEVVILTV
jgi:hypothetical protein